MIFLVTFNPAIDKYINVDKMELNQTNYYTKEDSEYGGKAQNVARIVSQYTDDYVLVSKSSEEQDEMIKSKILGINNKLFMCDEVRTNFKIKSNNNITELNLESSSICDTADFSIFNYLLEKTKEDDIILFAGSMSQEQIKLIKEYRKEFKSVKIILDSSSINIEDLKEIKPYMIKPNVEEITKLSMNNSKDISDDMNELFSIGIEHVIVSLGSKGSKHLSNDGLTNVSSIKGNPVNTVGAGDSFVGGFITGIIRNLEIEDTLKLASACGAATAFTQNIGDKKTIEKFIKLIKVEK